MLTVGTVTYTGKTVALYNTLKTFTLGDTNSVDHITVSKDLLYPNLIAERFLHCIESFEFYQFRFGSGAGLLEMAHHRLGGILFLGLAKTQLHSVIAVNVFLLDLRHNARASFYHSAGNVATVLVEETCHAYFLSDQSIHRAEFL